MIRPLALAAIAALCFAATACKHAVSDNVLIKGSCSEWNVDYIVSVHALPMITYGDLDKQYQSQFMASGEHPSDDQMFIQKLEVLRTLIDNKIMLQRAEKLGLMATDNDVEAKFTELRAPFTEEEFQKQLAARKMSVADLKTQLRQDLSIQKLFNKEITSHISISDKDVTDFYNANKSSFNYPEPHDTCIVIRTGARQYVAYNQKCTHLSCAVVPDLGRGRLHCPCHNGSFDLASGVPVAGPPRRPLERILLEMRGGDLYAVGGEVRA